MKMCELRIIVRSFVGVHSVCVAVMLVCNDSGNSQELKNEWPMTKKV